MASLASEYYSGSGERGDPNPRPKEEGGLYAQTVRYDLLLRLCYTLSSWFEFQLPLHYPPGGGQALVHLGLEYDGNALVSPVAPLADVPLQPLALQRLAFDTHPVQPSPPPDDGTREPEA